MSQRRRTTDIPLIPREVLFGNPDKAMPKVSHGPGAAPEELKPSAEPEEKPLPQGGPCAQELEPRPRPFAAPWDSITPRPHAPILPNL